MLVPELAASKGMRPDGTVRNALRMARGNWEARDSHDDLDAEIQAKFSQGYPRDSKTGFLTWGQRGLYSGSL